jgi:tRNA dimethylallyltransferase
MKRRVIYIIGPTASGKTRLAVNLAHALDGEIISADSRQLYKGMDIGTGKDLATYQVNGTSIAYHLIDCLVVGQVYHVHQFEKDANKAIEQIYKKGKMPIVCGGSGMYIDALLTGFSYAGIPANEQIQQRLANYDSQALKAQFNSIPATAVHKTADLSTKKRIIRAIEIAQYLIENPGFVAPKYPKFDSLIVAISMPVEERNKQIYQRLLNRINEGLIDEVASLMQLHQPDVLIRYGLEYKYVTLHLMGRLTKQEMVDKLYIAIRQFAKRQMTYLRKMQRDGKHIHWIDGTRPMQTMANEVLKIIEENNC